MTLSIGSTAPDFTAETTQGTITFHDWMGDNWAILFSHPKAFTPVCTTELGYMAGLGEEFAKRDTKILGLSVDSSQDNRDWLPDIEAVSGNKVDYPVVGDSDLKVAKLYNMLPAEETGSAEQRTAADNATVRAVYIVGLTESKGVATPVNWQSGDDVIIPPSVSDKEAKARFPQGFTTLRPYLRTVKID